MRERGEKERKSEKGGEGEKRERDIVCLVESTLNFSQSTA